MEFDDAKAAEKELHKRLQSDSVKGEWFETDVDVMSEIEKVAELDEDELPDVSQSRKNLKVPEDLFMTLRDDKDDQQSWPHYLEEQCLHDDTAALEVDGEVVGRLADIQMAVETVEERTGKIERAVESLGGGH